MTYLFFVRLMNGSCAYHEKTIHRFQKEKTMKTNILVLALTLVVGAKAHAAADPSQGQFNLSASVAQSCLVGVGTDTEAFADRASSEDVDFGEVGKLGTAGVNSKSLRIFEECNEDYTISIHSVNGGLTQIDSIQGGAEAAVLGYGMVYQHAGTLTPVGSPDMIGSANAEVYARPLDLDSTGTVVGNAGAKQARLAGISALTLATEKNDSLPVGNYEDTLIVNMTIDSEQ